MSRSIVVSFTCILFLLAGTGCSRPGASATPFPATLEEAITQISDSFGRLESFTARIRGTVNQKQGQSTSRATIDGRIECRPREPVALFRIEENASIQIEAPGIASTMSRQQQTTIIGDGQFVYSIAGVAQQKVAMKIPANKTGAGDVRQLLISLKEFQNLELLPAIEIDGSPAIAIAAVPKNPDPENVISRTIFCFHATHGVLLRREQFAGDDESTLVYEYYEPQFNIPIDAGRFVFDATGLRVVDRTSENPSQRPRSRPRPPRPPVLVPQSQPATNP